MNRAVVLLNILSAGLIHFIVAPEHFGHSPAHGIFFVIAGIAEIAWGVAFWRKPNRILYTFGLFMTGGLVTLWAVTRVLPAPFAGSPGDIEFWGLYSKIAELMVIAALIAMSHAGEIDGLDPKPNLWRLLFSAIFLAALSGTLLFRAAEPWLPSLAGQSLSDADTADHEH